MRCVAADFGNQFTKINLLEGDDSNTLVIPSVTADSPLGTRWLEYVGGTHKNLIGHRWAAGATAKRERRPTPTWITDKWRVALQLLLWTLLIEAQERESTLLVDQLITCLPDPQVDGMVMRAALQGEHVVRISGGQEVKVSLAEVQIEYEGAGAYRWAQSQGKVNPGINGLIDLGGGTTIYTLFDESGTVMEASRFVLEGAGIWDLCSMLAEADGIRLAAGGTPKNEVIAAAIADGSFTYGASSSGYDFHNDYIEALDRWIWRILSQTKALWRTWGEEIAQVLITGGGAELVREWITQKGLSSYFVVMDQPQLANVKGMLPAAESQVA